MHVSQAVAVEGSHGSSPLNGASTSYGSSQQDLLSVCFPVGWQCNRVLIQYIWAHCSLLRRYLRIFSAFAALFLPTAISTRWFWPSLERFPVSACWAAAASRATVKLSLQISSHIRLVLMEFAWYTTHWATQSYTYTYGLICDNR